jgi:hypothetical protein
MNQGKNKMKIHFVVESPIYVTEIPLWTCELSLGLLTLIPRHKQSFGHYHSYKLILLIEKERIR